MQKELDRKKNASNSLLQTKIMKFLLPIAMVSQLKEITTLYPATPSKYLKKKTGTDSTHYSTRFFIKSAEYPKIPIREKILVKKLQPCYLGMKKISINTKTFFI